MQLEEFPNSVKDAEEPPIDRASYASQPNRR
jgi:hypothetical protein